MDCSEEPAQELDATPVRDGYDIACDHAVLAQLLGHPPNSIRQHRVWMELPRPVVKPIDTYIAPRPIEPVEYRPA